MSDWGRPVRLADLARGPVRLTLQPDAAARAQIAKTLELESLPALSAEVVVSPWLDGASIDGRFAATVEQICGVTLDTFEQAAAGEISLRVVPAGSPNAPEEEGGEVALDLEAPDPPDVLEAEEIDVSGYVVEHLALEIDPFPRKPGAAFAFEPGAANDSPFAVLKGLKRPEG